MFVVWLDGQSVGWLVGLSDGRFVSLMFVCFNAIFENDKVISLQQSTKQRSCVRHVLPLKAIISPQEIKLEILVHMHLRFLMSLTEV